MIYDTCSHVTASLYCHLYFLLVFLYKTLHVKYQPHAPVIMIALSFDSFLPSFGITRVFILEMQNYLSCSLISKLRFDHDLVCRNMTLKILKTFSWKRFFVKLNGYFLLVNLRNIVIEKCLGVSAHYKERRSLVWRVQIGISPVVTQRAVCWSPGLGSSAYRVLVITLQTIQGVC